MESRRTLPAFILSIAASLAPATAQTVRLPEPDKDGWIKLFRGNNPGDLYIANNGANPPAKSKLAFPNDTYTGSGDTLKVTGKPGGQIYFNQGFSHYRVSYQMHFPGSTGNCGMLLHVQENDPTTSGFPRSVESQGDPRQGMGQLWPIGDIWVTITAKTKDGRITYDPSAPEITYGGKDWSSRVVAGKDGWAKPDYAVMSSRTGWVTQEAEVHGSDSLAHYVNDTLRIKYKQPRVSSGGTADNVTKYLKSGLIGWQAEGTPVWYREIRIKLLPGDPLYTPTYAGFNARNTIRQPIARKALILKDGVLGIREEGSVNGRIFDIGGRILPGLRKSAASNR